MATHLDLEEQEQLDQLKHFWNTYGTLITWVVLLAAGAFVAWNGWQYFQRTKAAQASALYDEVERSAQAGDTTRIERALADMKDKFAGTAYAQQAGLLGAKSVAEKGNADASRAALAGSRTKSVDPGYQAAAQLRLADVLSTPRPTTKRSSSCRPAAQGIRTAGRRPPRRCTACRSKKAEARDEYTKAWAGLDERVEYRKLIEVKLTALGVDPRQSGATPAAAPAAAASAGAKS